MLRVRSRISPLEVIALALGAFLATLLLPRDLTGSIDLFAVAYALLGTTLLLRRGVRRRPQA